MSRSSLYQVLRKTPEQPKCIHHLDKYFSLEEKDFVKDTFLYQQTANDFAFKPDFDTQQKAVQFFEKNTVKAEGCENAHFTEYDDLEDYVMAVCTAESE